ncbi:hypothetical protein NHX12_017696 [Muraenolepis orangiensis]|uniref:Uncharacterized protein n=1 Tax=Muraenolepis orangiensis TaxID=630683 RepID=A0A9Q0EYA9_9TELE|nr:hypothetical protein NHX12_017696 [Muraenolepis orangiensis]
MSSTKKPKDDDRFRRVQKDPRFWEMPEKESKVQIDKRFRAMFTDQRFQVKQTVDKRGRPVAHTTKEDLKRFYNLSESEGEEEEEEKRKGGGKDKVEVKKGESSGEVLQGKEDDDKEEEDEEDEDGEEEASDEDSEPDLARGMGNIETSSDEEEEEEEEEEDTVEAFLRREEEEIQHDWGDLCKDAPRGEEVCVCVCAGPVI